MTFLAGRPEKSEAAEHYFKYIDHVVGDDIVREIESQLEPTLEFLKAIPEEKSLHRYAAGKWSMREALNHITDTERAFNYRALWFARGFREPLVSFAQDFAAAGAMADRVAWADHVEEFHRVRLATVSLFRNMPPEAWMRTGVASGNRFTVRALAFVIAGHLTHHIKILRERYL